MAAPASKEEETAKQNSGDEEIAETIPPLSAEAKGNGAVPEPQPAIESGIKCQECRVAILDREVLKQNLQKGCTLDAYDEVTRLLWIKEDKVCSTALAEWDRKTELLAARVDRREKYIADFKNEIYQLIGFFSAFQGLVLTAVTQLTQTSSNHCGKVWSPVVLSGLAWIVAVVGVGQKFYNINLIQVDNKSEGFSRREAAAKGLKLRSFGKDFSFSAIKEKKPRKKSSSFIWLSLGIVVLTLSLFTGVFIASYFLILCDTGEARRLD
jgi:hypothetical protein